VSKRKPWPFTSQERIALSVAVLFLIALSALLATRALDRTGPSGQRMPSALLAYAFLVTSSAIIYFLASAQLRSSEMPAWQLGPLVFASCSVIAVVLGIFPSPSFPHFASGLATAALASAAAVVYQREGHSWAQWVFVAGWPTLFFAIGLRAWANLLSGIPVWYPIFVLAYLMAWALPFVSPRISRFVFREQTTPQTLVGRWLLSFSLALLPIAGSLGAVAGMYLPRYGMHNETLAIVAVLSTAAGLALAQSSSHQLHSRHVRRSTS